ncbi:hypothetical protein QTP86_005296, partial [Hemibagrus guttatus]
EDSFELHSVDLELEAVEKQIRDLQVKQAQLRQGKAALESSRTDAHLSQVNSRRETITPTTSTPCASLPRPSGRMRPAQVFRSLRRRGTTQPGCSSSGRRKPTPRARTSPPPPPPVFEIPTQNRFAPLRETACDAVIIGDSIVGHVRATAAKGKVHICCLPGARVLDVSAQVPAILKKKHRSCGPPCWHERHRAEADGDPEEGLQEPGGAGTHPHRPRRGSSCQDHFPHSSEESRGSVDYLLLINGYSQGVKIRNALFVEKTGIFSGSVLGSTVLMACTQAELEQLSSQTTSPGHYAPSD